MSERQRHVKARQAILRGEAPEKRIFIAQEDLEFKKLLIENATRPTGEIVSILSNYANENLI